MFVCSNRAASFVGVRPEGLLRWFRRAVSSYGYPIRTVKHGKHWLADERDVIVMAKVNREIPLTRGGPGSRERAEQMKCLAYRVRSKLDPAP